MPSLSRTTRPALPPAARRWTAAAFAALALAGGAAAAAPLDDLRRLVEANQFEQAWQLGQRTPELLGNAHFDFLYGLAAVASGHVAEGVLALERHLAVVPANDRARLELARGFFMLGEYPRARAEFEFVLRYNPTAATRRSIEGYLQAMSLRDVAERRASANFYAEFGAGRDTNANIGTDHDTITLASGPESLDPASPSRSTPDNFGQFSAGGQQSLRVSNQFSVFAGGDLDLRRNDRKHDYDQASLALNTGFTQLHASGLYRATLSVAELRVGGQRYREALALGVEGQWTLSPTLALLGQWQVAEHRYGRSQVDGVVQSEEQRDLRSVAWAVMLTRQFPEAPGAPSAGVRLSFTQDTNLRFRPDLNREVPLARVFGAVSPNPRLRLSAGLTAYRQDFGGTDIVFGSVRRDRAWAVDLSAAWAVDERWSLRGEVLRQANHSNQNLYDSRRAMAALKLRYQF